MVIFPFSSGKSAVWSKPIRKRRWYGTGSGSDRMRALKLRVIGLSSDILRKLSLASPRYRSGFLHHSAVRFTDYISCVR
jgi:hypothetical protein